MTVPPGDSTGTLAARRRDLVADCSRCVGLCCVVPAFAASADFAIDKPAGTPCPNLLADHRCGIHDRLRDRGFPGCVVFDCFGAGQHLVEVTYAGTPPDPRAVGAELTVLRGLHELLWHLAEAAALADGTAWSDEVATLTDHIRGRTTLGPDALAAVDADAERRPVGDLLARLSAHVRHGDDGPRHRHADLVGRRWRGRDLRGADLRGSLLLGADLREADLTRADLLGADLRGADLRGADLATALFLTGPQLEAARGDAATRIPDTLPRPRHWEEHPPVSPAAASPASRSRARPARSRRR